MCIFTRDASVGETRIFARPDGARRQLLAYSMDVALDGMGAMVLPLPVRGEQPNRDVWVELP